MSKRTRHGSISIYIYFFLLFCVLMLAVGKKKRSRRRKENILTCEHQVQEYYITERHVASLRLMMNKTLHVIIYGNIIYCFFLFVDHSRNKTTLLSLLRVCELKRTVLIEVGVVSVSPSRTNYCIGYSKRALVNYILSRVWREKTTSFELFVWYLFGAKNCHKLINRLIECFLTVISIFALFEM